MFGREKVEIRMCSSKWLRINEKSACKCVINYEHNGIKENIYSQLDVNGRIQLARYNLYLRLWKNA
jgi:hypothetical protein